MASSRGYSHARVQEYWQRVWEEAGVYELSDDAEDPTYVLGMFPYTSGELHMGHVRNYAITDAHARYRRMQGDDVLHPMGWDAFGLPAENAAYERDTDPESWTRSCIERMRDELREMGFGYDWSREITTCDPDYYRWNQWLFRRLHEAGLVDYRGAAVEWCPDCETALADAQVLEPDDPDGPERGVCWRCGTAVGRRELDQWFLTITDYAEELYAGLDALEGWDDGVRETQRDWIGRQEGALARFELAGDREREVEVFTTRPDTVFGATYVAVAPGHDLAALAARRDETVAAYVDGAPGDGRDPTAGVATDLAVVHPLTGERLPVYVAAYVLDDVGTGAVMGVPAHNERDFAFARAHDLPVRRAVEPVGEDDPLPDAAYTGEGVLVGATDEYEGLASAAARERLLDEPALEPTVEYRLRDWLVSRQRYWGTPIPVVHCPDCGPVLVPEAELPVELPEFVNTTGNPLEAATEWTETTCPDCGGPATRETDTMDTFVDSSWYFLRFLSPDLDEAPFDPERAAEWMPVDVYVGGEEHAVLHLLYIRFLTRALADAGLVEIREPVERLLTQGTVLHGGEKMSKSKGNAVAPHTYGAETTRLFVLAAAHPRQDFEWTAMDVDAAYEFGQAVHGLVREFVDGEVESRPHAADHDRYVERAIDRTVAAVTDEFERARFHRVIAELEEFVGLLRRYRDHRPPSRHTYARALRTLAALVAPVAPFLAEECWSLLGEPGLAVEADWPEPLRDADDYRTERAVVRSTLDDVRRITDVVGIDDPERIDLAVAPAWKYRAYRRARAVEPGGAVVGHVLADDEVARHGDAAAEYAADLEAGHPGLEPVLDGDRELETLSRAVWLFEDEFGAETVVRRAEPGSDAAETAEPGRPAIHVD